MGEVKADDGLRNAMIFDNQPEAVEFIQELPGILRELGLSDRFKAVPTPRVISEAQQRGRHFKRFNYYAACMRDLHPSEPLPVITVADIAEARRRARYKETLPRLSSRRKGQQYEAFGQSMTLNQWAKAVGVSWPTLNARIEAGKSMEEAITELALKNAS
ncbi:hypothetical protein [Streptomyces luteogriseus]|uniref:hypothetical protein n=1 Tax=Streptomyces luteogriseus TaxID=68233 RepID=UPI0037B61B2B